MRKQLTGLLASMALGIAPFAQAQFVVIDPANLAQTTLTAIRSLIQIENQIQSLQNEAQMLINEAKNLEHLNLNSLNRLTALLATTQQLLNTAQGMTFQVVQAAATFERFYPTDYGAGTTAAQMDADALQRWANSRFALNTAVQLQAQVSQNMAPDQALLSDLVNSSQNADGILQAAQSTNQLIALQVREAMQLQQLEAAQGRATALEHARAVAAEARSRTLRGHFMQGTAYTPTPIQPFP
jgi:type IV secretion system protein TrbJ